MGVQDASGFFTFNNGSLIENKENILHIWLRITVINIFKYENKCWVKQFFPIFHGINAMDFHDRMKLKVQVFIEINFCLPFMFSYIVLKKY